MLPRLIAARSFPAGARSLRTSGGAAAAPEAIVEAMQTDSTSAAARSILYVAEDGAPPIARRGLDFDSKCDSKGKPSEHVNPRGADSCTRVTRSCSLRAIR